MFCNRSASVKVLSGISADWNLFWYNNRDFYQTEQVAVVVYILTDGIDDASGMDNDTV